MQSSHVVKYFSWRPVRQLLSVACLLATPVLAAGPTPVAVPIPGVGSTPAAGATPAATPSPVVLAEMVVLEIRNQVASASKQIDQLIKEREDLSAQLAKASSQLVQARDDKETATATEQLSKLNQKLASKDTELQDVVRRQQHLLTMAEKQGAKLDEFESKRRLFRFVTGAGVMLHRLPDLQIGRAGDGAAPGSGDARPGTMELDVCAGVAFLPLDLNSRDGGQTFSLGGMIGLGGHAFPANLYTGLTFKMGFLYLNGGVNFRKSEGGRPWTVTQPLAWEGGWTPTLFAGLSLDSEALLALQQVFPTKSAPEGLKVEPK
jgi:hypothetical protein